MKEKIDAIIISHAHRDYLGGITHILHPDVEVHIPRSFSKQLKKEISNRAELIEITVSEKIAPDIYTTGEMGSIKEQAMVLKINKKIVIVTGCAHPGLDNIINLARDFGELYGVIGGFHNFNNVECLKDASLIMPCHCTRHKNKLKQSFPDQYMECKTGSMIEI